MKRIRLVTLMLAIVMAWVGFASSSFAFETSQQMAAMSVDHASMDMAGMNMADCPSGKSGMMKMDASKCAMSCYGLVTSIMSNSLPVIAEALPIQGGPLTHSTSRMPSRSLGVPTPPPNFA